MEVVLREGAREYLRELVLLGQPWEPCRCSFVVGGRHLLRLEPGAPGRSEVLDGRLNLAEVVEVARTHAKEGD